MGGSSSQSSIGQRMRCQSSRWHWKLSSSTASALLCVCTRMSAQAFRLAPPAGTPAPQQPRRLGLGVPRASQMPSKLRSTRLGGLRKPRGDAGASAGSSGEGDAASKEGSAGGGQKFSTSLPASKRRPPENDDIWSKSSVFEFKSLNDPDTNACAYVGLSGQPRGASSSDRRRRRDEEARGPSPELRLTSSQQPRVQAGSGIGGGGVEELLEAEPTTTSPFGGQRAGAPGAIDEEFFKFREREVLATTARRREVERKWRGPPGSGGGVDSGAGSAVKVELATQLGVPATSTYEELRTAYRVEIKRCHPDLAGDNEFRVKFLERKFQKLQGCWDKFNAEQQAAGAGAAAAAEAEGGQAARAQARARAREEIRVRQAAAAAAAAEAQRRRRPVMDQGRTVLDSGNTSSC